MGERDIVIVAEEHQPNLFELQSEKGLNLFTNIISVIGIPAIEIKTAVAGRKITRLSEEIRVFTKDGKLLGVDETIIISLDDAFRVELHDSITVVSPKTGYK